MVLSLLALRKSKIIFHLPKIKVYIDVFLEKYVIAYNVSTYCVGEFSGSLDHVFDSHNAIRHVGSAGQPVALILHFSQSISQVGEEFVQFIH